MDRPYECVRAHLFGGITQPRGVGWVYPRRSSSRWGRPVPTGPQHRPAHRPDRGSRLAPYGGLGALPDVDGELPAP